MLTGTVFVSARAHADSEFLSKVTIRPTVSLNISSSSVSGGNSSNSLVSFKIGAIADYAFKEDWGFRSGLLFSGQGGKWDQSVNGGSISWSLNATENPWYLEIPLDVYYSYEYKDVTFTGFTGFPISFGLFGNQKIEDGGRGNGTVGDTSRSAFDSLNRFALSYNIGVEATWRKFSLGLEYNRHLTNDAKTGGTSHIQVFSINLGYNFKL